MKPNARSERRIGGTDERQVSSTLIDRIAHDMRSPMGVLGQAMNELVEDFGPNLDDDRRLLIALAERSLRCLGHIADTLTYAAALETGKLELRMGMVDVARLLDDAVARAIALHPRKEVTIEIDERPDRADGRAFADGERVTIALVEVLLDAVRHARHLVRVRCDASTRDLRMLVENDGVPIADSEHTAYFTRTASRSSASHSSLGLGLWIAREVVAAHGGSIALLPRTIDEGARDDGNRISISLPRSPTRVVGSTQ
jgi:two-component system sensor histidine kinase KdpD